MAIEQLKNSQLRLTFYDGENPETGEPMYSRKSFNNIKPTATAAQLSAVAEAFTSLQERPLVNVERQDLSDIIKQQ